MILHIRPDGSGESALAQAVAQHRAGFCANFDLQAGADFADTMPPIEAGHACSEFLADGVPGTPQRPHRTARRHIGAVAVVATVAVCCFVLPLLAHQYAKHQQVQPAPLPASVPSVWA